MIRFWKVKNAILTVDCLGEEEEIVKLGDLGLRTFLNFYKKGRTEEGTEANKLLVAFTAPSALVK